MAKCTEEGCKVLVTGQCINGLDINTCPHYNDKEESTLINKAIASLEVDAELDKIDETDHPVRAVKDTMDIFKGTALNSTQANIMASNSLTRLIVLAGMPDSGKTTLILSLMHLFQTNASFQGYLFAGSNTLLEFEEKSHPSKIESDRQEADTHRTVIGDPLFLHLKISDPEHDNATTDLLFTDIAGEIFSGILNNADTAKKFVLGHRADHFVLFFDSERISSLSERAASKTAGMGILRSLTETQVIKQHTNIQIVFSRWDLYLNKDSREIHEAFIETIKKDVLKQFGSKYTIDFFEVSARPKNSSLKFGHGLEKLFPVWIKRSILDANPLDHVSQVRVEGSRQFFNYHYNQTQL